MAAGPRGSAAVACTPPTPLWRHGVGRVGGWGRVSELRDEMVEEIREAADEQAALGDDGIDRLEACPTGRRDGDGDGEREGTQ